MPPRTYVAIAFDETWFLTIALGTVVAPNRPVARAYQRIWCGAVVRRGLRSFVAFLTPSALNTMRIALSRRRCYARAMRFMLVLPKRGSYALVTR
jgi:hypothetical protein